MKKRTVGMLMAFTLAFGLLVGSLFGAGQPHMKNALTHLKNAEASLKRATADKGGHRVNALKLISQAMDEVNKGIAYDKTH